MNHKVAGDGSGAAGRMTSDRLRQLLDAYGANPDRWPPEEKEAALALLETSAEARDERDRAADLDALLDRAPAEQPSPALAARVLAAAPARTVKTMLRPVLARPGIRAGARSTDGARRRLWKYAGATAAPLAAAATLVLWLTQPLDAPRRESMQFTIAELGAYETPMDVLLDPPGFDLVGTLPSLGCTDSGLGCPELDFPPELESRTNLMRGVYA